LDGGFPELKAVSVLRREAQTQELVGLSTLRVFSGDQSDEACNR
jgi:hypothetical protein